jgi:NAD(P)-dependent dehydrogenase (short-subunit alcohol dehydrogenase family)
LKSTPEQITNGYMRGGAARVYIASRDEKSLKEAADEFNSKGYPGKCVPLTANLASYEGVIGLVQELEKREKCKSELSGSCQLRGNAADQFGHATGLHVLVNNSGNNWGAP